MDIAVLIDANQTLTRAVHPRESTFPSAARGTCPSARTLARDFTRRMATTATTMTRRPMGMTSRTGSDDVRKLSIRTVVGVSVSVGRVDVVADIAEAACVARADYCRLRWSRVLRVQWVHAAASKISACWKLLIDIQDRLEAYIYQRGNQLHDVHGRWIVLVRMRGKSFNHHSTASSHQSSCLPNYIANNC